MEKKSGVITESFDQFGLVTEEAVEWDNEESVVQDLAAAFNSDKDPKHDEDDAEAAKAIEREIRDSLDLSKGRYSSWGKAGEFKVDGTEYNVIESEDEAERIALEMVKENLEQEPELFNQDWLQQHITITPTDKRVLSNDLADSDVANMSDDEIIQVAGLEDEYEAADEAGDEDKKEALLTQAKDDVRSTRSDEIEKELDDPLQYFVNDQGMYSREDLLKASFISIDIEAAAEDAVQTDGWAHFLSLYDGNYETTPDGLVYFRE